MIIRGHPRKHKLNSPLDHEITDLDMQGHEIQNVKLRNVEMHSDLDMNYFRIKRLPIAHENDEPVTLIQLKQRAFKGKTYVVGDDINSCDFTSINDAISNVDAYSTLLIISDFEEDVVINKPLRLIFNDTFLNGNIYVLSDDVTIKGVMLYDGKKITNYNESSESYVEISNLNIENVSVSGNEAINIQNANYVTIKGVNTSGGDNIIYLNNVNYATIYNCYIYNITKIINFYWGVGINVVNSQNVIVRDNFVFDSDDSVQKVGVQFSNVKNGVVEGIIGVGKGIWSLVRIGDSSDNVTAMGNVLENGQWVVNLCSPKRATVVGNVALNCKYGIWLDRGEDMTAVGNILIGSDWEGGKGDRGIDIRIGATANVTVTGNIIRNYTYAIYGTTTQTTTVVPITISNNSISECDYGSFTSSSYVTFILIGNRYYNVPNLVNSRNFVTKLGEVIV